MHPYNAIGAHVNECCDYVNVIVLIIRVIIIAVKYGVLQFTVTLKSQFSLCCCADDVSPS